MDPTSQAAYELASRGLLRPGGKSPPLIYGIKCIHFKPPDFTLGISTQNLQNGSINCLFDQLFDFFKLLKNLIS